jgi:hypothetical protein
MKNHKQLLLALSMLHLGMLVHLEHLQRYNSPSTRL